ncbi:MAG TPA: DUF5130 family protein [Mycobacteriales bacterium]|nr:DUF5130 family protein [Mycobacteriales bacterium]
MPSGEGFTDSQVREISRAAARAGAQSGLHFSVYVGDRDQAGRDWAERLHTALGAAAPRAVLLAVSPEDRTLEVVTGDVAARRLDDRTCGLAALSMTTAFAVGDLLGGITTGLQMLASAAGAAPAD